MDQKDEVSLFDIKVLLYKRIDLIKKWFKKKKRRKGLSVEDKKKLDKEQKQKIREAEASYDIKFKRRNNKLPNIMLDIWMYKSYLKKNKGNNSDGVKKSDVKWSIKDLRMRLKKVSRGKKNKRNERMVSLVSLMNCKKSEISSNHFTPE